MAEASLSDPWVRHGDRLALQRRVLRLGRPPRRWKKPAWAAAALAEPREVVVSAQLIKGATGAWLRVGNGMGVLEEETEGFGESCRQWVR